MKSFLFEDGDGSCLPNWSRELGPQKRNFDQILKIRGITSKLEQSRDPKRDWLGSEDEWIWIWNKIIL